MTKDRRIQVALIGAGAVVVAAIITAVLPSWWQSRSTPVMGDIVIAGTVVDQATNRGVGQASVSIVGRGESDVSVDNGNFRVSFRSEIPKDRLIRIHVTKDGYEPFDGTTTPTETLIVQLRKK